MKQLKLLALFAVTLQQGAAQYKVTVRPVKTSVSTTSNALIATPPGYDSLRSTPYPVVFVGKGLNMTFAQVQGSGIFKALATGFVPDTFVFVHLDRGSTTIIDVVPHAIRSLIALNKVNIDSNNLFFTGFSAGGGYSLSSWFGRNIAPPLSNVFLTQLARRTRAIVAQAPNHDVNEKNFTMADSVQIPTWIVVGGSDGAGYIIRANKFRDSTNARKPGNTEVLIRPGVGHGGWDDVTMGRVKMLDGKTMWQFFKANVKQPGTPPPVTVVQQVVLSLGLGVLRVYSNGTYTITSN